jgi:hypothetical protein
LVTSVCYSDCLAELGLVLDLGLDVSRETEDIFFEEKKQQLQERKPDTRKPERKPQEPRTWKQRPWDHPAKLPNGDRAVSLAWEDLERVPPPLAAGLGASITALDLSHNRLR